MIVVFMLHLLVADLPDAPLSARKPDRPLVIDWSKRWRVHTSPFSSWRKTSWPGAGK